ncbi:mycoides cluster lipoprotein, LppA/P72 family, partial [Mycoplasma putrefaciens]
MKKVNKFLAALPVIFITSLSAISCTNKSNKIDIDNNNNNNNNGVNKPDNNHKKPDSQNNPVEDFKDLDSLKTEIDFQHYNFYKEKDPITAW